MKWHYIHRTELNWLNRTNMILTHKKVSEKWLQGDKRNGKWAGSYIVLFYSSTLYMSHSPIYYSLLVEIIAKYFLIIIHTDSVWHTHSDECIRSNSEFLPKDALAFRLSLGAAWDWTTSLLISGWSALPPEEQPRWFKISITTANHRCFTLQHLHEVMSMTAEVDWDMAGSTSLLSSIICLSFSSFSAIATSSSPVPTFFTSEVPLSESDGSSSTPPTWPLEREKRENRIPPIPFPRLAAP